MPNRTEVFKLTQDDWAPSYQLNGPYGGRRDGKLVIVAISELADGTHRVSVWGADDDGMERDYVNDWGAAIELFDDVIQQEYVNKQWLRGQGFVQA